MFEWTMQYFVIILANGGFERDASISNLLTLIRELEKM